MAKKKKQDKQSWTAADILKLVVEKDQSREFTDLLQRFEEDFDLYTLKAYEAEEGHQSYTSSAPLNDFEKIFNGINKASLTWQIAVAEDAPEKEREAATKGEALLTGVLDRADRALRKAGEPPLRQGLAWWGCARGMAGLKCLIYTDENRGTAMDIRSLDPMQLRWENGMDGLVWVAYCYQVKWGEAFDRWGIELRDKTETALIVDFWTRNINALVLKEGSVNGVGLSQFLKEPTEHGLGHIPIWIGFASGMPTNFTRNNESTLQYRPKSVWRASRNIYEPRNKLASFILDIVERSIAGTLEYATEDGKKQLKGDPFQNYQVINTVFGKEKLAFLTPPPAPPETNILFSLLDRDKQESTVPFPIGYGPDPQAHSGTALAMMNDNTRSLYDSYTALIVENGFRWLCEEILSQFKTKGQKLSLRGFNTKGKFFVVEANPDDIRDDWYVNVICEPRLPRDDEKELMMAIQATQPGRDGMPLLSRFTALEKMLKLQDPDAEKTRIEEERINAMIASNPSIQIRKVAQALTDKGDLEGARELLASIPAPPGGQTSPQEGMGQSGMGQQGQLPTPEELAQLRVIVQRMKAEGQPIPPEIEAILQQGV